MKPDAIGSEDAPKLSPRERECLQLARSLTSKDIGRELGISPYTVDQHIAAATRKLGAPNRRTAFRLIVEAENGSFKDKPLQAAENDGITAERVDSGRADTPLAVRAESWKFYESLIGATAAPLNRFLAILFISAASMLVVVTIGVGAHEFSRLIQSASGLTKDLNKTDAISISVVWSAGVLIVHGINLVFGDRYVRDLTFMILIATLATWACAAAPISGKPALLFIIDLCFLGGMFSYVSLSRAPIWALIMTAWSLLGVVVFAVSNYDPAISNISTFLSSNFWYTLSSLILLAVTLRRHAPTLTRSRSYPPGT